MKMTPTRLALLRAIGDGQVKRHRPWSGRRPSYDEWRQDDGRPRTVSRTVESLYEAELIRIGPAEHVSVFSPRLWELTDAGREKLASD